MKTVARVVAVGLALAGVVLCLPPEAAYACEKCFGAGNSETARAISLSMLALLGMTGIVWGGIGAFFFNMRKRARLLEPGDLAVTEHGDIIPRPHDE